MILNPTEANDAPAITEYTEEPTWTETVAASFTAGIIDNTAIAKTKYHFDGVEESMNAYATTDPENEYVYRAMKTSLSRRLAQYEVLYEQGKTEALEDMPQGDVYLKFKELEGLNGNHTLQETYGISDELAKEEYIKANETLEVSDKWTAKLIGRGGAVFTDPFTLSTLPVGGGAAVGSGIAMNAGKAFLTEAALEAGVQTIIAPTVFSYKQELGIKTSIMEEAGNAVAGIFMAGGGRAIGSALVDVGAKALGKGEFAPLQKENLDLTPEGINALKEKDPELGKAYEDMEVTRTTEDMNEHAMNLHEAAFDNPPSKIKNPNEQGEALNKAEPIPMEDPAIVKAAQEAKPLKYNDSEIKMYAGEDAHGEAVYKSHNELREELTTESKALQGVEK